LAARSYNNPDFASANAAVYTKLRLQINLISWDDETGVRHFAGIFFIARSTSVDALSFAAAAIRPPRSAR
jgi:hypothetical protein